MTYPFALFSRIETGVPGRACRLAMLLLLLGMVPARAQFSDKVIERGKASTVLILSMDENGDGGSGSGFIISDQGHVATNFHVVDGCSTWVVIFASGDRVFMEESNLVASSRENDLAILQTRKFPGAEVFTLATAEPSSGQKVMSIGFPGALEVPSTASGLSKVAEGELRGSAGAVAPFIPATFSGEVGRFQQEAELPFADGVSVRADMIQHNAKISGGNSGGPLIDVEGRVSGIIFATGSDLSGAVDYAFAIHSSHLVTLARAHKVPITVSAAHVSLPGSANFLQIILFVAVAGLSVITFLLVLRKPRTAIADGLSRLTHRGGPREVPVGRSVQPPPNTPAPKDGGQRVAASGARMTLRGREPGGRSFHLDLDAEDFRQNRGRLILGRNRELSQLHLPHDSVSRQHAVFSMRDGVVLIEDRNSGNGTLVNGRQLPLGAAPTALRSGDRIKFGEVELVFDLLS